MQAAPCASKMNEHNPNTSLSIDVVREVTIGSQTDTHIQISLVAESDSSEHHNNRVRVSQTEDMPHVTFDVCPTSFSSNTRKNDHLTGKTDSPTVRTTCKCGDTVCTCGHDAPITKPENRTDTPWARQVKASRREENDIITDGRTQPMHLELVAQDWAGKTHPRQHGANWARKAYNSKRKERLRKYLRQTFLAHFIAALLALGAEASFLWVCTMVSPRAPLHVIMYHGDILLAQQAKYENSLLAQPPPNATDISVLRENVFRETASFVNTINTQKGYGARIFVYEISYAGAGLVVLLVLASMVYYQRKHPVVKSRGMLYLTLVFGSAICVYIVTFFVSMACLLRFNVFPTDVDYTQSSVLQREIQRQARDLLIVFNTEVFALSLFFAVLCMRQRLIAQVFTQTILATSKRTHISPLKFTAGLTVLFYVVGVSTHFVWYFVDSYHPRGLRYGASGSVAFGLLADAFVFYYLFQARGASLQFNDFFCNLRFCVVALFVYALLILISYVAPSHLISGAIGWSSIGRMVVSLQTLDQFFTQAIQAKWDPAKLPQLHSPSFLSAGQLAYFLSRTKRQTTVVHVHEGEPSSSGLVTTGVVDGARSMRSEHD